MNYNNLKQFFCSIGEDRNDHDVHRWKSCRHVNIFKIKHRVCCRYVYSVGGRLTTASKKDTKVNRLIDDRAYSNNSTTNLNFLKKNCFK